MREWTEQEEQEMIDRAKAGEPEANYEMSLWALARGEEEPEEPRWNRLAAKCLVKAAQAGYGPAQERMASLLGTGSGEQRPARKNRTARPVPEEPDLEDEPEEPEAEEEEEEAPLQPRRSRRTAEAREQEYDRESRRPARRQKLTRQISTARRRAPAEEYEDEDELEDSAEDEGRQPRRGARSPRRASGSPFTNWGEAQWRKVEMVCVALCVVLLIAIAVMIFTGRRSGGGENGSSAIPPAGEVSSAATIPTAAPAGNYPDEATRAEIESADLDIPPMAEDYRSGPTTATVSVNSISLRLRRGPNTSYPDITTMPDGSKVEVFADKNDWSLVRYYGEEGTVYGWCSSSYLIIDATPVTITAPTPEAAG